MKKIVLVVLVACFTITLFAGPYDHMIDKTFNMQEWDGRVAIYLENDEWVVEYNISKEMEYVFVSKTSGLVKSSGLQRNKLDGKLWLNDEGYDVILEGNKLVSRIPKNKLFGNKTVIFSWEFWEPGDYLSLIDHSPFAHSNPENDGKARFKAELYSNGNVIPKGTSG